MTDATKAREPSPFVTMAEGGRMLGISKSTFWQLVESGAIPAVRLQPKKPGQRGGLKVHRAEVEAYRDRGRLPVWEAAAGLQQLQAPPPAPTVDVAQLVRGIGRAIEGAIAPAKEVQR